MKYFGCDCKHEIIGVDKAFGEFVTVAMYEYKGGKTPWGYRLEAAFNMLFKGDYTPDDVLLVAEDAKDLGNHLLKLAREIVNEATAEKVAEQKRTEADPSSAARLLLFPTNEFICSKGDPNPDSGKCQCPVCSIEVKE